MKKCELERTLEDRCVAKVDAIGGKALKLKLDGVRGFPDRTVLLLPAIQPGQWRDTGTGGRVFFIEFKRAKVGVISQQQHRWRVLLTQLGFHVYTIDTDDDFDAILEQWR